MDRDEVVYRITDENRISVANVQEAIAEAWADMQHDGTVAHQTALAAGIDLAALPKEAGEAVEVKPRGAGVGAVEVAVIGLLGKMAYDVWKDIWTHVIFPRIKKRFGEKALVPAATQS
jgi:hypothetical protein